MKKRILEAQILNALNSVRILLLIGSHRAGKTAVINSVTEQLPKEKTLKITENSRVKHLIGLPKVEINKLVKQYDYLIVDSPTKLSETEINYLSRIFPKKIIIATSLKVNFRKIDNKDLQVFIIHPFSIKELYSDFQEAKENIAQHMVYGSYPEVLEAKDKKDKIFMLSDILETNLKNTVTQALNLEFGKLVKILKFLAQNIGQNLSFPVLITNLEMDKSEIKRYLEFLEQRFIIFTMRSFSRSLPKEMSKAQKFYFWDMGVRNLLINNFDDINTRRDIDQVWENFCISERLKRNHSLNYQADNYFWKTYDHKEIPYVEESHGFLFAYSFIWKKSPTHYPRQFLNAYSNSVFSVINLEKLWDFIS